MNKRALIIGGNGFIGLNLANRLAKDNWVVDGVDNFATSLPTKDISIYRNFEGKDWLDVESSAYADLDYDRIYYLASYPSPKSYKVHQEETLALGYEGVKKAIALAIACKATLFLASSSECYGNSTEKMTEATNYGWVNTYGERSCYDESKRVMETLAYIFKDACDVRVGRIFNTYGPGMAMDGRVFTEFLKAASNEKDIHIYRSPTVTRSPCYIDDLLDQIEVLMSSDRKAPTNLGNKTEYSLLDIAELCKKVTNSSSTVVVDVNGSDKDDPTVRQPDLTVIKSLGYNNLKQVTLEDGLKHLLSYMTANRLC